MAHLQVMREKYLEYSSYEDFQYLLVNIRKQEELFSSSEQDDHAFHHEYVLVHNLDLMLPNKKKVYDIL